MKIAAEMPDQRLTRAQRRALKQAHQLQIEQRYHKERQRNVLAQPGVHQVALVLDHLKAGFNVPKIFRSAQAFGAAEVHLINIGVFDPAPAKGAFRKVPAHFHETYAQVQAELLQNGYTLYAMDPTKGVALPGTQLAEKSAFIIGHEEDGLSFDPEQYPHIQYLHIPLYGQMESLNASVAASIVLYEYVRQWSV